VNQFGVEVIPKEENWSPTHQHRCVGARIATKQTLPFSVIPKKFIPWNDAKNVAPKKSRF
jgi:hypothetical protein